jgi:hypothetical protein
VLDERGSLNCSNTDCVRVLRRHQTYSNKMGRRETRTMSCGCWPRVDEGMGAARGQEAHLGLLSANMCDG